MTAFDTVWDLLKLDPPEYQGYHKAPLATDYYPPIFNMNSMMPGVYSNPHYYENTYLDEIMPILEMVRNDPFALIPVYRSVPKGMQSEINPGDWVTPTRSYAEMHGERFDDGYDLLEEEVRAHTLLNEGNSLHEYGWLGHRDGYKPEINKWIRDLLRDEVME